MKGFLTTDFRVPARARRGFTLTETAIAIAAIGFILGAVWVASGAVNANNDSQVTVREILQIVANYRTFYERSGIDIPGCATAASDVTCIGVNAGYFPPEMANTAACVTGTTGTYPRTIWGKGTYVNVLTCQTNNTIEVNVTGVSKSACNTIAADLFGLPDVTLESINSNNQWLPPYGTATVLTPVQTAAQCTGATSNTILVGFKL